MQAFHMTKDLKALSKQVGVATQSAGVPLARSCFRLVQPRIRMLVGGHNSQADQISEMGWLANFMS